jgi:hypothetical protein
VDIEQGKVDVEVFNQTDAALSVLTEKYSSIPDVNTKDGYEFVKAGVKELTGYRTNLDAERKRIKQPYLEAGRIIDAEAKRITEKLVVLEDPMKAEKKKVDDQKKRQEEERLTRLAEKVQAIRDMTTKARNQPSTEIAKMIDEVDAIDTKRDYYDLTREAIKAQQDVLQELSEMYGQQLKYEQAQEEQERFRKEQAIEREQRRITDKISQLRMIPADLMGRPSEEIEGNLKNLQNYDIPRDEFGDQYDEGQAARQKAMEQLEGMLKQQRMVEEAQTKIDPEPEVIETPAPPAQATAANPAKVIMRQGNEQPKPAHEPAEPEAVKLDPVMSTPDVWAELAAWSDKWELSLQASQELSDILKRYL